MKLRREPSQHGSARSTVIRQKQKAATSRRVVPAGAAFSSSMVALTFATLTLSPTAALAQNRDEDIFGPSPAPAPAKPEKKPEKKPEPAQGSRGSETAPSDAAPSEQKPSEAPSAPAGEGPAQEAQPSAPPEAGSTPEAVKTGEPHPTEGATPNESSAVEAAPPQGEPPAASASEEAGSRDSDILGSPNEEVKFTDDAPPEDPLAIGGLLYLRAQSFPLQGQPPKDWSLTVPTLMDLYLDVRPNDRVRGFVMGRMTYDPTLPPEGNTSLVATGGPLAPGAATPGTLPLNSIFVQRDRRPVTVLDQLWIRFDIDHTLFVTAGKQHVRWGTARFWSPTDFLHLTFRNPVDVFDSRTGTSMLKLHLPIESLAWNFYGYVVTEDLQATDTVSEVAGALRAEFVVGTTELGLGVFARRGTQPKYAADISTGVGDFDLYGEVALRDSAEIDRVRFNPNGVPQPVTRESWENDQQFAMRQLQSAVDALYPIERTSGLKPQAVGGLSYTRKYNDNDTFTVGTEYFYNALGYDNVRDYPGLILPHSQPLQDPATFFYLGKHYGAVFATFPAPFSLDLHTFTVSCLGNLSDQSFISRLDYSLTLLTHLTFEAFFGVHFGRDQGEFRFGVENLAIGGLTVDQPPALIDLGIALRMSI